MTKGRRRVLWLALILKTASIEPRFVGTTYREFEASLERQLEEIPRGRLKSVRREVRRAVSAAGSLKAAGEVLMPIGVQQGSRRLEAPIQPSLEEVAGRPPETPRCSVCRMRCGKKKRSFASYAEAAQLVAMQGDPNLHVYSCRVPGTGGDVWHVGHSQKTRRAGPGLVTPTPQRRDPDGVNAPQHKDPHMKIEAKLNNLFTVGINAAALLLIGCAVGMRWSHRPEVALCICMVGGILMAVRDLAVGVLWFTVTARWVRSVTVHANDRS